METNDCLAVEIEAETENSNTTYTCGQATCQQGVARAVT